MRTYNTHTIKHVGFGVLTVVEMKSSVSGILMPCNPLKVSVLEERTASIFKVEE
jgi:hypothetical protein